MTHNSSNPNDTTAQFYDEIIAGLLKHEGITNDELALIKSIVKPPARVLDIGCGTGRHAIPLAATGYDVTGIDSSKKMLAIAQNKVVQKNALRNNVKFICSDVFTYNPTTDNQQPTTFDLISFFWNAFNEICLTKSSAKRLLRICKSLLNEEGTILINMNKSDWYKENSDPIDFISHMPNFAYHYNWKIVQTNNRTNTTTSEESVTILDEIEHPIAKHTSVIKQRWWHIDELREICDALGLTVHDPIRELHDEFFVLMGKNSQ